MRFKVIMVLTTSLVLASCDQSVPKGKAISKDQALSMCKTATLQARSVVGLPNAVQNFFDVCMADKGYGHAVLTECNSGYTRPNSNPAYDYVSDRIAIGVAPLENCYVAK